MNMPERGSGMGATVSPLQFMCRVVQMQPFYSYKATFEFFLREIHQVLLFCCFAHRPVGIG